MSANSINHQAPDSPLGDMNVSTFLNDYWQKKPLVIRQPMSDFSLPISAEELAGLSLEAEVESRIIQEQGQKSPWELWHGPMSQSLFKRLPTDSPWTLLVQAVDQWVPEVYAFKNRFEFIPSWRLDDVMMSYANKGGSVGPHFDQYDVFLVQAQGIRQWQIGDFCTGEDELLDHSQLKILKHFEVQDSFDLNPGDILYLPPKLAHYGPALTDDCMTLSVGFKAPSHVQIFDSFTRFLDQELTDGKRYQDQNLTLRDWSGEILEEDLLRVFNCFVDSLKDQDHLCDWFGKLMTEPKYPDLEPPIEGIVGFDTLVEDIQPFTRLQLDESTRLAFYGVNASNPLHDVTHRDEFKTFIDGEVYTLPRYLERFITHLSSCKYALVSDVLASVNEHDLFRELLVDWINRQKLVLVR